LLVFYVQTIIVYIFSLYARLSLNRNRVIRFACISFVIVVLVLVSGLRSGIGDTGDYVHLYKLIGPEYVSSGGYEPGFILFFRVLKIISDNPQFMIFVTSVIINVAIIWAISKYPGYFELSTFLYITSGYYLVTMNGIRQSIAAAVLFACTHFIIKGKFKSFTAAVLLASTFHTSAVILIPVYFVARNEAWSKKICKYIIVLLIALIFFQPIMDYVFTLLGDSKYGAYKDFNEGGANIIRVAIYAVPVFLSYIKRRQIKEQWPESDVFVNITLLNFLIMCFSLYNWIFARFTIYFQLYGIVLLAYIIKSIPRREEKNFLYYGLVTCYFIFFYYEHVITLNIVYRSNYISMVNTMITQL
jgi:transmembrane protein EpsG